MLRVEMFNPARRDAQTLAAVERHAVHASDGALCHFIFKWKQGEQTSILDLLESGGFIDFDFDSRFSVLS